MTRLTFGGAAYRFPRWSPDGRYVVFCVRGQWHLPGSCGWRQPAASADTEQGPSACRGRSRRMASGWRTTKPQATTNLDGACWQDQGGQLKAGTPEPFLKSTFTDSTPSFSPDGRWLAYQSNESGTNEVYVRAFPPPSSGQGGKWQISNNGGTVPRWSRTGHELVYQSGDQIHGRELHRERRHVRGREAARVDRETRRNAVGISRRTASAWRW